MLVCAEVTVQVPGVVAGPFEPALSRLLEHLLPLAVLLGLVVLLAVLDESSPATGCSAGPLLLESLLSRRFGRAGFELFDVSPVSLWSMAAWGLWRTAMRAFSGGTTISHDSSRDWVECVRDTCGSRVPDGAQVAW